MHSPFPHSNSVWMLQEEFSAAEEDNEGDELWLSRSQNVTVYTEQTSTLHTGELRGTISIHTVVKSTVTTFLSQHL